MAIITLNNNSLSSVTALPAGVGGKVLQVVSNESTTQVTSNTPNTYIDSSLSATITPSSSSNKVLILVNQHISIYDTSPKSGGSIRLLRGNTNIYGAGDQYELYSEFRNSGATNSFFYHRADMKFLDSPSTTSATTYKMQMTAAEGTINMRAQNNSYKSTITLMEIAG